MKDSLCRSLLALTLWCCCLLSYAQQIVSAEYFIDVDPGHGEGQSIPVTSSAEIEFSVDIETSGLSPGVHMLYIRVMDDSGVWSIAQSQAFFVIETNSGVARSVSAVEYFIDADPGHGKGQSIPVTSRAEIEVSVDIETSGLSPGVHMLYVRVKDDSGVWGITQSQAFFVRDTNSGASRSVSAVEYFIDVDPGAGRGTPVVGDRSAFEIPTDNLSPGVHSLYIRAKDDKGVWGHVDQRNFAIEGKLAQLTSLVSAEYFIDTKTPVPGSGTKLPFDASQMVDLKKDLDVDLAEGPHTLSVQFRDNLGNLSVVETKEFTVATPRIDELSPRSGGNIGDVTVSILGASFDENAKVLLRREGVPDIVVPDSLISIINGEQMLATFDLRGQALGVYDVVIVLDDGTLLTVDDGFEIVQGIKADTWAEVIGFDRIRRDQWQTYTISYGNNGNVDANGVPLWIVIGQDTTVSVDFDFEISQSAKYHDELDSIPIYFTLDSLFGEKYNCKLYPLYIPNIRAGAVETVNIRLRAVNNFEIMAYTTTPFYQSPFSEDLKACYKGVFLQPAFKNALAKLEKELGRSLPGVNCIISLLELNTKYRDYLADPYVQYLQGGAPTHGSLMWSLSTTIFGCAAEFIPATAVYKYSKLLWGTAVAFSFIKDTYSLSNNKILPCLRVLGIVKRKVATQKEDLGIKPIRNVTSIDPNDKVGSKGAGSGNYLKGDSPFQYLIRFENKSSATAAAQEVLIIDTLDRNMLDLSTLELKFFSFGKRTFNIPPGRKNYTGEVDLRPTNDLVLRVQITLDETTGILTWRYSSIDPYSRVATENPDAGFLPPNVEAPEGEGGVFFTIRPKEDLLTDVKISNKAYIYFDVNEVIPTTPWFNTVDRDAPVSHVSTLPATQASESFEVEWQGQDTGSGIDYYSIFYSKDNEPFQHWLDTTSTSAIFAGESGSSYSFYSTVVDSAGNFESAPLVPDAQTSILTITAIEPEVWDRIQVFPNPTTSTLTIKRPPEMSDSKILLVSPQGHIVEELHVDHNDRVDISRFRKGLFLLGIEYQGRVMYRKVIFQ